MAIPAARRILSRRFLPTLVPPRTASALFTLCLPAMSARRRAHAWLCTALLPLTALWPGLGQAWNVTVTPGQRTLFLQVGVGSQSSNNRTRNEVSLTVPLIALGNRVPQRMNSNSTQATSSLNNAPTCNTVQQQVYVAAAYRAPASATGAAQLRVFTPTQLSASNGRTMPISEIGWASSHPLGGNDIPAGYFTGGMQVLGTLQPNRWMESCLTFSYRNWAMRAAGTYTATAEYTLVAP